MSSSDHMLEHELNSCPVLLCHPFQDTYSRSLWLSFRLYNPSCVHTILRQCNESAAVPEYVIHCSYIREFAGVLLFFASGDQMFHTELKLWANLGQISVHFNIFSYQNRDIFLKVDVHIFISNWSRGI